MSSSNGTNDLCAPGAKDDYIFLGLALGPGALKSRSQGTTSHLEAIAKAAPKGVAPLNLKISYHQS